MPVPVPALPQLTGLLWEGQAPNMEETLDLAGQCQGQGWGGKLDFIPVL